MAIKKSFDTNYGVAATFYQITGAWFDFPLKEIVFNFEGFVDEKAAKDGKFAIDWKEYRLSFKGAKIDLLLKAAEAGSLLDIFKDGCVVDDVERPDQPQLERNANDAGAAG